MADAVSGIGAGGANAMTRVDYLEHMLAQRPGQSAGAGPAAPLNAAAASALSGLAENSRTYAEGLASVSSRSLGALLKAPGDTVTDEMARLDVGGRAGMRPESDPVPRDLTQIIEEQGRQAIRLAEATADTMDRLNKVKHASKSIEIFANLSNGARNSLNTLLRG